MSKTTIVTEKFDSEGKLVERVTETKDTQPYTTYPYYPYWSSGLYKTDPFKIVYDVD